MIHNKLFGVSTISLFYLISKTSAIYFFKIYFPLHIKHFVSNDSHGKYRLYVRFTSIGTVRIYPERKPT